MRQRNHLLVTSLLLGIALFPGIGHTLDLTFEPRLQAGVIDYKFERKGGTTTTTTAATGDTITVKDSGQTSIDTMPFVGVGTTVFASRFFFDIYLQKAFSGTDTSTTRFDYPSYEEDQLAFPTETHIWDSDFDREEYSISIGYALGSNWALFGGLRTAKANFTETLTQDDEITHPGEHFRIKRRGKGNNSLKEKGFFFGGAYAFGINEHTSLTLTAALAVLDGEYNQSGAINFEEYINGEKTREAIEDLNINSDGNAVGLNLGVSWKGRIVENLGYSLGVNRYSYDFSASNDEVSDFSETALRFSAGLSYRF